MAKAPRGVAWRRSNRWLVLRWGTMAAVLGALALVVVLHPAMWKQRPEISKEMPPPAPAGSLTGAQRSASAPSPAPASPENAWAKAQVQARESTGERVVAGSASGTTQEGRGGSGLTAGARPAPPPPSALSNEPRALSDKTAKVTGESRGGLQALRTTSQSAPVGEGNSGVGAAQVTVAKAAPRAPTRAPVLSAQVRMSETASSRQVMKLAAGSLTALWSISSDGNVQRSTDGGKTFESVPVATGIRFQATAASGNDVWAGGAGGALFHSIDAGATWVRITLNFEGNTVTENITAIQLHDAQHLTVTTASGSGWISDDGGQHWQKQP